MSLEDEIDLQANDISRISADVRGDYATMRPASSASRA
jgi:hypothetical protein